MKINENVLLQHAEDAAFLWQRRQDVLRANRLTYDQAARIDGRLEGHIDGLLAADGAGWASVLEPLGGNAWPGEIFVATYLALQEPRARVGQVLDLLDDAVDLGPMVSAIGWQPWQRMALLLDSWATSKDRRLRYLSLAGASVHRQYPGALDAALRSTDVALRARAAKAVGELGVVLHAGPLRELLGDDDRVRFSAACSLSRLGRDPEPVAATLVALADPRSCDGVRAAGALVDLDPRQAPNHFRSWSGSPSTLRLAGAVAEALGDPVFVPDLIAWMNDKASARFAGEAFRTITGVDLEYCDLYDDPPTDFDDGPNDDPDDENVTPDLDHQLAWPAAPRVARWWTENSARFPRGIRHLDGHRVGSVEASVGRSELAALASLVQSGRPGHRALAARALGRTAPPLPLIETRAPVRATNALPGWPPWAERLGSTSAGEMSRGAR